MKIYISLTPNNNKLLNFYSLPSIITLNKSRSMKWTGHVGRMREKENACRLLVGNPGGRRPLGRLRHRWMGNIKMDLGETDGVIWTELI
jgi:hypothetical protein